MTRAELVLEKLREKGYRITKQRRNVLDIILENDCSSSKEIYYKALEQNPKIGAATVYRMIHALEEIGAIDRKNMYKVDALQPSEERESGGYIVVFDDHTMCHLSEDKLNELLEIGLRACGELGERRVSRMIAKKE